MSLYQPCEVEIYSPIFQMGKLGLPWMDPGDVWTRRMYGDEDGKNQDDSWVSPKWREGQVDSEWLLVVAADTVRVMLRAVCVLQVVATRGGSGV